MTRCEQAKEYHKKGFNCAQAVLASFSDLTGLSDAESFNIGGGFGGGAQTGELCGAITGAVMTLGLLHPISKDDPIGGKRRTGKLAREFQARFAEQFGPLRCADLLKTKVLPVGSAKEMGLTGRCDILIVTAVELVEQMLQEES